MTKNQIELIKAREIERSNREQEKLASAGQKYNLGGAVLRGLASSLIPHGDTLLNLVSRHNERANERQAIYPSFRGRRRGDLS